MTANTAAFLLQRLMQWGITRVYGYPGDGINGIMGAFDRIDDQLKFVQVRHEEMAAFMACAHAKFTGLPGVCLATSGPGAIHLLNGLYDAKMDHQPVVAIVGQQSRDALGGHYQQEVDLVSLFKDVASEYVQMISTPSQTRHVVDRALRIARSQRTVTCIIVPNDIQEMRAIPKPPRAHGTIHSGIDYTTPRVIPRDDDLARAAAVLNDCERVAVLVGAGALTATDEVIAVADRLGSGIAKALLGKAAVPDDLPNVTGLIGLLGTKPTYDMIKECDALLMVGSSFPYSEWLPKEGAARGVQIDIDGRMLNLRYPMEVALVGDSAETLRALLPLLRQKEDGWRRKIEANVRNWWRTLEARALQDADPINPQRVFWELSKRLPDNCILTADSGSAANWWARDICIRRGMMASLSGNLATMGPALPYAISAKFAFPERPVIAMVGDGAMQMNGNAELITLAKYWREWSNPALVIGILNNRDLNQVTWEQRVLGGDPKWVNSQSLPDFSYAKYAELVGLRGIRVDRPEQLVPAWEEALRSDCPVVLEACTDPNVPPLPPHISINQAKHFMQALLKGDVDRRGIIRQSARDFIQQLMPH
ncbi:MAG: thiamine pyrophosphate-requiring protein [Gammaproteobacteria bacterium]|nr:thiamine pyrophosphate-requiring protein [Gammaproteobacteria bacterium]